ncbi:hypothetical protein BH09ACT8_BH09ACT8_15620 [soil metagenome]
MSALAEGILFFQEHPEIHASSDRIRELSEHLSRFGATIADAPSAVTVMVPPEFLTRIAGRLDAVAAESVERPQPACSILPINNPLNDRIVLQSNLIGI